MHLINLLTVILTSVAVRAAPPRWPRDVKQVYQAQIKPVRWVTTFDGSIAADSDVQLEWSGGDGRGWRVYYIPQWIGQPEYYPIDIVANTTSTTLTWHTPNFLAYPNGTTFILGVNDGSQSLERGWYDVSGLLKFVEPVRRKVEERRGWWPLLGKALRTTRFIGDS